MKLTKQNLLHLAREITNTAEYVKEELHQTQGRVLICPPDKAQHLIDLMKRVAALIRKISDDNCPS